MVNIRCSASDRIRVPARPAQHVHRRVPDRQRRTRRSASTIGGGTPDMTIGRPCRESSGSASYLHRCAGMRRRSLWNRLCGDLLTFNAGFLRFGHLKSQVPLSEIGPPEDNRRSDKN